MNLLQSLLRRKRAEKRETVEDIQKERQNILSEQSGFYVTEAYKMLRTNVLFSLAGKQQCCVLAVTSAYQHEGKSITALNLAISMAESNKRVLLVDCDLRKPKVARLLNVSSKIGLSNVLLNPELMTKAIITHSRHNVDALLSGSVPPNPSELLISPNMTTILEMLKKEYDFIILDTPPINVVSDALGMTENVDGYLLVVRSGVSDRPSLAHALEQLSYAKARVFGYILNGVRIQKMSYGRYNRYSHYSHYGRYGSYAYGYSDAYVHADITEKTEETPK